MLAYVFTDNFAVNAFDGGGMRIIAIGGPTTLGNPVWSPDGRKILFVARNSIDGGASCALRLVSSNGTGLKAVTNGDACDQEPSWQAIAT